MAEVRRRRPVKASSPISDQPEIIASSHSKSMMDWIRKQPLWIVLAVASGSCAATNGVFAKLTTTSLTSSFASSLAELLGLDEDNAYVNLALRATFFGLNIVFNIAMWALFTAALTRSSSTTRVSIVNVSSNFFITAILGAIIFAERLPPGWWLGASLLAAGNVVIGRREEAGRADGNIGLDETRTGSQGAESLLYEHQEEGLIQQNESKNEDKVHFESSMKVGVEVDNPI